MERNHFNFANVLSLSFLTCSVLLLVQSDKKIQSSILFKVCATALQLDPNSGVPMVTKGCADLAWCQISHGCNPYFMSCVTCCHGDRCNSADNMTTNITLTTDSWRTTTMKQTRNWRTTSLPQTWTTNSCELLLKKNSM